MTLVVIPARLESTRLPGKPLALIHGVPMIVHVWRRALEADLGPVVVATDDAAIAAVVRDAGGDAVITRHDHPSGTDRIAEALGVVDPDRRHAVIVNFQGDLPTIAAPVVRQTAALLDDPDVAIGTPVAAIIDPAEACAPHVVKMVGSALGPRRFRALYFTRACARGYCTTTSVCMCGGGTRWSDLSRWRLPVWSSGSGWSNCVPWKPACASTRSLWTTSPWVLTPQRTSTRPAPFSATVKSFLVLFFKKEPLSSLTTHAARARRRHW